MTRIPSTTTPSDPTPVGPAHLPPSGQTPESLRERLGLAAPAFEEELERLRDLMPGTDRYERLVQDILRRAPSQEQLAAVQLIAAMLGTWRTVFHAEDLAHLCLVPKDSPEFARLRGQLLLAKANHDVTMDAFEHDDERAEDLRTWMLQMQEMSRA